MVKEGQAGLLYRDGVYQRTLLPGRHWVSRRQSLRLVTTAEQMLEVGSQEALATDGFLPRVSAVAQYAVTDPLRAAASFEPCHSLLAIEIQLAIRGLVSARAAEALARTPRTELDAELLSAVQPRGAAIGLAVTSVRVRDIILPSDLRRLLTGVERARRDGQAALERAHGEQAALRSLANAARMLRNNPELQTLRLIQALAEGKGATVVLGSTGGLLPLRGEETGAGPALPE